MNKGKMVLEGNSEAVFKETETLRKYNMRLPKIGHLMEILHKKDHLDVSPYAMTISKARKSINKLFGEENE